MRTPSPLAAAVAFGMLYPAVATADPLPPAANVALPVAAPESAVPPPVVALPVATASAQPTKPAAWTAGMLRTVRAAAIHESEVDHQELFHSRLGYASMGLYPSFTVHSGVVIATRKAGVSSRLIHDNPTIRSLGWIPVAVSDTGNLNLEAGDHALAVRVSRNNTDGSGDQNINLSTHCQIGISVDGNPIADSTVDVYNDKYSANMQRESRNPRGQIISRAESNHEAVVVGTGITLSEGGAHPPVEFRHVCFHAANTTIGRLFTDAYESQQAEVNGRARDAVWDELNMVRDYGFCHHKLLFANKGNDWLTNPDYYRVNDADDVLIEYGTMKSGRFVPFAHDDVMFDSNLEHPPVAAPPAMKALPTEFVGGWDVKAYEQSNKPYDKREIAGSKRRSFDVPIPEGTTPSRDFKVTRQDASVALSDAQSIGKLPGTAPYTLVASSKIVVSAPGTYTVALTQRSDYNREAWLECAMSMTASTDGSDPVDAIPLTYGRTISTFSWSRFGSVEVPTASADTPAVITLSVRWSCDGSYGVDDEAVKGGMRKLSVKPPPGTVPHDAIAADVTADALFLVPRIKGPGDREFRVPSASRGEFIIRKTEQQETKQAAAKLKVKL